MKSSGQPKQIENVQNGTSQAPYTRIRIRFHPQTFCCVFDRRQTVKEYYIVLCGSVDMYRNSILNRLVGMRLEQVLANKLRQLLWEQSRAVDFLT